MYNIALVTIKTSILMQYMRFFNGPSIRKTYKTVCKILLGVILSFGVWVFFASIFGCRPVNFFWNRTNPNGRCFNEKAFYFSNAAFNIITDLIILAVPMPMFKSLQLPRKQKHVLMAVFAAGGLYVL